MYDITPPLQNNKRRERLITQKAVFGYLLIDYKRTLYAIHITPAVNIWTIPRYVYEYIYIQLNTVWDDFTHGLP